MDNNIEKFETLLQQIILNSLSYHDTDREEKFYHMFVLGLIQALGNDYWITSNRENGYGRYDILLNPKNKNKKAFILEFKVSENENYLENKALEGLNQILEKHYDTELKEKGVSNITYISIAFCDKKIFIKYR